MSKQPKGNALGISLILMMFILLCLITFATLSFLLAKSDNELSLSSAENVLEFYEADAEAQQQLSAIDAILADCYQQSADADGYFDAVCEALDVAEFTWELTDGQLWVTVQTAASDKEILIGTLEILYPTSAEYYRIESWILQSSQS